MKISRELTCSPGALPFEVEDVYGNYLGSEDDFAGVFVISSNGIAVGGSEGVGGRWTCSTAVCCKMFWDMYISYLGFQKL